MRDALNEVISLQEEYSAENTPAMQLRGTLIRRTLPHELRDIGGTLREAMEGFGDDADAQGKDNMGRMSRIPWVRWYSKSRSPSATTGWYIVYLFHPDATGVSLCLSHGSTHMEGSNLISRSDEEVAELMSWARGVIGSDFASVDGVRPGINLGKFDLAVAYERTTVVSKFYPRGQVPDDAELTADLLNFVGPLAKLYRAKERGIEPGAASPDALALKEEIERFTAPLKSKSKGQGWLSAPARKLVEMHAMSHARTWLKEQNFQFRDVSATDSCDFRATRGGHEWVIEVKGTTGGPASVLLTRNEVELHRASHPKNVLLIVHGISVSEDVTKVSGGQLIALEPWELDEERLRPICFEYRLQ